MISIWDEWCTFMGKIFLRFTIILFIEETFTKEYFLNLAEFIFYDASSNCQYKSEEWILQRKCTTAKYVFFCSCITNSP